MTIKQLYQEYPHLVILHGITRIGAESTVPPEKTFADRINYAIENSKNSKPSIHSFTFGQDGDAHLWANTGILLQDANIKAAHKDDTGLRKETMYLADTLFPNPDYKSILSDPNRTSYNEIVVQHAEAIGIFLRAYDGQFTAKEIREASSNLHLPVYILHDNGLLRTQWSGHANTFFSDNEEFLTLREILSQP